MIILSKLKGAVNLGPTISQSFKLNNASISQAREKVVALHQYASELSLIETGELIELNEKACLYQE